MPHVLEQEKDVTPATILWRRFFSDKSAVAGLVFVILLTLLAICAPVLINGKPFFIAFQDGTWKSPALRDFFAPDAQEILVEKIFNALFLALLVLTPAFFLLRKASGQKRKYVILLLSILVALPFCLMKTKMDQTNWRNISTKDNVTYSIFAPIPYGPFETSEEIFAGPSKKHIFGTDQIGRDVAARMLYGARVSLSVGFFSTIISLIIGITLGLFSGYRGGKIDLLVQRCVEIMICFPTFLLLLILMSIMLDYGIRQSILLVIIVLGITGWPGLSRLVRGEVLKQRQIAYIQSCECLGIPLYSILFRHLLPNVSGPIFVYFSFSVSSAILSANSLSFLGFGVQDPSASWGELLKQAFSDPLLHWNLMLWPGLSIFLTMISFNFIAEGIRHAIDRKI